MSEHTPLTEAAIEVLHDAGWYGRADLTTAQLDGIVNTLADAGFLAARMSTATADTGLREWVRSLPDKIREYADIFEGQQREDIARAAAFVEFAMPFALAAAAAPTTDTGARDE